MTLYDLLEEFAFDKETLTRLLIQLDSWIEYLHNRGFCIYDFDPKKIILENGKLTFNSFRKILGIGNYNNDDIEYDSNNIKRINIFQEIKVGLMAYNKMPVDGNMNQEHFNFLQENLEKFNQNGQIPEEIYEYYEEVFRRLNVVYMNDYLAKKQQEINGEQNTNVRRKNLATIPGMAYAKEDAAFVNILFIPSIITLVYLLGLFVYTFILK